MKTREQLILAILALWVEDEASADAIDNDHSYTHASCGYMDAQSAVEDFLTMDRAQLEVVYSNYLAKTKEAA